VKKFQQIVILIGFIFWSLHLQVFAQDEERDQEFLTLPINDTSVNAHFDLDNEDNSVEDATRYTCEGDCDVTPGNHAYDAHDGVDFGGLIGTEVVATLSGRVSHVTSHYADN